MNSCSLKEAAKIATMAANILARQFKIPFSDYYSIDISPDVHILRVMRRTGLVDSNADLDSIIYKARELNPKFPGIIDFHAGRLGVPGADRIIRIVANVLFVMIVKK